MKLGFFQGKTLNIWEDVGHIFIGLIPMLGWLREWIQFPPGDPLYLKFVPGTPPHYIGRSIPSEGSYPYAPHDRVMDAYRDFLGYAIGNSLATATLVGLLIWKW
jgi:hypothetical protein